MLSLGKRGVVDKSLDLSRPDCLGSGYPNVPLSINFQFKLHSTAATFTEKEQGLCFIPSFF